MNQPPPWPETLTAVQAWLRWFLESDFTKPGPAVSGEIIIKEQQPQDQED